jgi:hypothetical protein
LCVKNFIRGGVTITILHDEVELIQQFEVVLEVPDKTYLVNIKKYIKNASRIYETYHSSYGSWPL